MTEGQRKIAIDAFSAHPSWEWLFLFPDGCVREENEYLASLPSKAVPGSRVAILVGRNHPELAACRSGTSAFPGPRLDDDSLISG